MTPLTFLYTNIGRGHPFYLDGVVETLLTSGHDSNHLEITDVFRESGIFSRQAWRTVRWLYRRGSSPGLVSALYERIRTDQDYNHPSLALRLLGSALQRRFRATDAPLVVAHPSLVAMLRDQARVHYQHGEVVTPAEAVVRGAARVFVPTDEAAAPFLAAGYSAEQVKVSGLCIEPLVTGRARQAMARRLERLNSEAPLVGACFSSGAEPAHHVRFLVRAVVAAIGAGGQMFVVATPGGRLHRAVEAAVRREGIRMGRLSPEVQADQVVSPLGLALQGERGGEARLTRSLLERLDYFIAPSHERTHWALGLGLPMFVLGPPVGPFAPLNLEKLLRAGVAETIQSDAEADTLGDRLTRLRATGELVKMAQNGWGHYPIDGFARIAEHLVESTT